MLKTVAYLGIPGSYSYTAAKTHFPTGVELKGAPTFKAVFEAIEKRQADYGVIPIENTLAGSIYENYDLLQSNKVIIVAEQYVKVEHRVLGSQKVDLKDVTAIYSHPKALEQCYRFFDQHPWIKKVSYSDTAQAAKYVANEKRQDWVALASAHAGELYGLETVKRNVEDDPHNYTRFLVIQKQNHVPKKANKCSLIVQIPHISGSMHKTLGALDDCECNLTKIESRPLKGKIFEYIFYLDFCFDPDKYTSEEVVENLKQRGAKVTHLGTYEANHI